MSTWTCYPSYCHDLRLAKQEHQIRHQIVMRLVNRPTEWFVECPSHGTSPFVRQNTRSRWWSRRESVLNSEVSHPILAKAVRFQVLGKSPATFYLRLNKRIWERLPSLARNWYAVRSYGAWLHTLVCLRARRQQFFGTFFLRNRPALELMRRLADRKAKGSTLKIAVLGCSIGAEVYSILWSIRSARPDLKVLLDT